MLSSLSSMLIIYVSALLGMAFFTLLERKILGYIQIRKGPNKVSSMGIPQPFADALKLLTKEQSKPSMANTTIFIMAPMMSLILALTLWTLYPLSNPPYFILMSVLMFMCISSLNVYTTLGAGWFSNSKYALLGALRGVAQTISYEVSMALILLSPLLLATSLTMTNITKTLTTWPMFMFPMLFMCWFTTTLAETNRTPFDFAEGESELVSGFNTEYSSGTFALLFMAEYANILVMSLFTILFFSASMKSSFPLDMLETSKVMIVALMFLWIRGTLPRMRYDKLMSLTWKSFLLYALVLLILNSSMVTLMT